jgi:hypothetical protein
MIYKQYHVQDSGTSSPRSDYPFSDLQATQASDSSSVDYLVPIEFGMVVCTAPITDNTLRTAVSGGGSVSDREGVELPRGMSRILTEKKMKMTPSENVVNIRGRSLFTAKDIFGIEFDDLKAVDEVEEAKDGTEADPAANETDNNANNANNANSEVVGGKEKSQAQIEMDEDQWCVICLTDPKVVVLLPCMHLCVCQDCLVHVDKCPVCRRGFNEYAVKQDASPMTCSLPSPHP